MTFYLIKLKTAAAKQAKDKIAENSMDWNNGSLQKGKKKHTLIYKVRIELETVCFHRTIRTIWS